MKAVFMLVAILFSAVVFGQEKNLFKKLGTDSLSRFYLDGNLLKGFSDGILSNPSESAWNMPTIKMPNTGKFLANNRKGHDIYIMDHDGMACLVPDTTFISTMPVRGMTLQKLPLSRP